MARTGPSKFERAPNDLYRTSDPHPVRVLLPHLPPACRFYEPCAGYGDLIFQLIEAGHTCTGALDIAPPADAFWYSSMDDPTERPIVQGDAREVLIGKVAPETDIIVSNPPWTREPMHQIIHWLYWQRPTWMLFDARWSYTDQARPYMPLCRKIVAVGRVRWFEGTKDKDTRDSAWHLFAPAGTTEFVGRNA